MSHSPSPNRCWWTVTDKPSLHLQIAGDASPCSHRRRFSFIGDALKCYFSSCRCWFSTHSSPILDDSHLSPILDYFEVLFQPIRCQFRPFATKSSLLIQTIRDDLESVRFFFFSFGSCLLRMSIYQLFSFALVLFLFFFFFFGN